MELGSGTSPREGPKRGGRQGGRSRPRKRPGEEAREHSRGKAPGSPAWPELRVRGQELRLGTELGHEGPKSPCGPHPVGPAGKPGLVESRRASGGLWTGGPMSKG